MDNDFVTLLRPKGWQRWALSNLLQRRMPGTPNGATQYGIQRQLDHKRLHTPLADWSRPTMRGLEIARRDFIPPRVVTRRDVRKGSPEAPAVPADDWQEVVEAVPLPSATSDCNIPSTQSARGSDDTSRSHLR